MPTSRAHVPYLVPTRKSLPQWEITCASGGSTWACSSGKSLTGSAWIPSTVTNWELNRTSPALRLLPRLFQFLGYMPCPAGQSWADRLRNSRRSLGLSQERLAGVLGVDESTVARWERGSRRPGAVLLERLEAILTA